MFTVKATYNNETRKFTFSEPHFPSFIQLCSQLYRVFPISNSYYLSKLLFCPTDGARVLVGMEVHNEAQYQNYIQPFIGRAWSGGLLKFHVFDETPHKAPLATTSTSSITSGNPHWRSTSRPVECSPWARPSAVPIVVPPPRVQLPLPATRPSPMDVDRPHPHSISRSASGQSCCSVAEGKIEMKELMNNFLRDLTHTMSSTFGDASEFVVSRSSTPRAITAEGSALGVKVNQKDMDISSLPIPGSFVQPAALENQGSPENDKEIHPGVWCDYCGRAIRGLRSKCIECANYDLCERCILRHDAVNLHKGHYLQGEDHAFRTILAPPTVPPAADAAAVAEATAPSIEVDVSAPPVVHIGIVCDHCNEVPIGTRHKCLDCPDYDLCATCLPRAHDVHDSHHQFFAIEEPGRVIVHTVFDGDASREHRNRLNDQCNAQGMKLHNARCDLCDSKVIGDRYKCADCPDYDLCASCHQIAPEQHPRHGFIKISTPQDLLPGSAERPRHFAQCNSCSKTIFGIRYKCMHPSCPDYDLCEHCEALPIPVHPEVHPMLKMRTSDTVVPTVYRVGGTELINSQPRVAEAAVATVPVVPDTADASVQQSFPETTDASVQQSVPETAEVSVSAVVHPSLAEVGVRTDAMKVEAPQTASFVVDPTFPILEPLVKSESPAHESEHASHIVHPMPASAEAQEANRMMRMLVQEFDQIDSFPRLPTPTPPGSFFDLTSFSFPAPSKGRAFRASESQMVQVSAPVPLTSSTPRWLPPPICNLPPPVSVPTPPTPPAPPVPMIWSIPPPLPSSPWTVAVPSPVSTPPRVPTPPPVPVKSWIAQSQAPSPPVAVPQPPPLISRFPMAPRSPMAYLELRALFISDEFISDGQVFPAGAEFIKSWQMQNGGDVAWPDTTELVFVAGNRMAAFPGAPSRYPVGAVEPGQIVSIYAGDMKTPDHPGKYVSYWRLSNGSKPFGQSVWCDIVVPEPDEAPSSKHSSLSSSSVIMPESAPVLSTIADATELVAPRTLGSPVTGSVPSTVASDVSPPPSVSGDSSISLIDHSDSDSEIWQEAQTAPVPLAHEGGDIEYVVLYDDDSSSSSEA